jgi:hypothetical protein
MLEKFKKWRESKPLFTHDLEFFQEVYNETPTAFKRDVLLQFIGLLNLCQKLSDRIDYLEKNSEDDEDD